MSSEYKRGWREAIEAATREIKRRQVVVQSGDDAIGNTALHYAACGIAALSPPRDAERATGGEAHSSPIKLPDSPPQEDVREWLDDVRRRAYEVGDHKTQRCTERLLALLDREARR